MSHIVIGMQILWGLNKRKPILPLGYYYIEERRCWTFAQWGSRYYYVSTEDNGVLYRRIIKRAGHCNECGAPKTRMCVDTDQVVVLPQRQLTWPNHEQIHTTR